MKKVEADATTVKNVKEKLVNQLTKTERQCSADVQYSKRECLEVVGIPTSTIYPMIYWRLMSPMLLINLEFMLRGKTFRHVIV